MSQNKLAVHIGISRQYIGEIDKGKVILTPTLQRAMFILLDVLQKLKKTISYSIINLLYNYGIGEDAEVLALF